MDLDHKMPTRKEGDRFGITDGAPSAVYSNEQLSRMLDSTDAAHAAGGKDMQRKVWEAFPEPMRFAFNWSKWTYVPPKK